MIKSHIIKFLTVPCLFISLVMTSKEHKFLILIMFINFFFRDCVFVSCLLILCLIPGHTDFFLCFLLKPFILYVLHLDLLSSSDYFLNKLLFLSRDNFSFSFLLLFFFLPIDVQLFQPIFERLSFLHLITFSSW